jgi:general secretion pathway protein G
VYFNYVKKAKVTAARTQIGLIEQAIFDFRLDTGGLPSSLAELRKNTSGKEQWDGPYLKKAVPKDPWKNEYVYSVPGEHGDFDLMSYGSDGQPGGDGDAKDIGNWSNEED